MSSPDASLSPPPRTVPQPSVQGPVVIKFLMEGVPGESRASIQVKFNCMFNRWAGSVRCGRGRAGASLTDTGQDLTFSEASSSD